MKVTEIHVVIPPCPKERAGQIMDALMVLDRNGVLKDPFISASKETLEVGFTLP